MNEPSPITLLFTGLPLTSDKFIPGVTTVALIRKDGRTVIFDTGPYAYRPILLGRLKQAGITPADIDTVVLSHVHWDNAANADLFPNAQIVLHEKELAYAENPQLHDDQTPGYAARALRKLKLHTVSGEPEIIAGARIIELPGHTPGSIGLLIGNELLAGDAVSSAADAIAHKAGLLASRKEADAKQSLKKALSLANIIYPGHDRPFRNDTSMQYLEDYAIRIRFFTDPSGPDEEIRVGSFAPKSFASWP